MSKRTQYNWRVTSAKPGNSLQPMTMTITLDAALESAQRHAKELPGCTTRVEERKGGDWKLWHEGNWADQPED